MVELQAGGAPIDFVSQSHSDIILKTANNYLHPMAKCVELHEISCKIAKSSLSPMAKCVKLQQNCFKMTTLSLLPMAKYVELQPHEKGKENDWTS